MTLKSSICGCKQRSASMLILLRNWYPNVANKLILAKKWHPLDGESGNMLGLISSGKNNVIRSLLIFSLGLLTTPDAAMKLNWILSTEVGTGLILSNCHIIDLKREISQVNPTTWGCRQPGTRIHNKSISLIFHRAESKHHFKAKKKTHRSIAIWQTPTVTKFPPKNRTMATTTMRRIQKPVSLS